MRFLTPFAGLRPPTDHGVDRPELYAQQCVQVTGTNRPRTYQQHPQHHQTSGSVGVRIHYVLLKQHTPPGGFAPRTPPTTPRCDGVVRGDKQTHAHYVSVLFHKVTAAIAEGKRPAPFRTRKLSPPAPMVLHSRGCGRVGHRRTKIRYRRRPSGR